MFPGKAYTPGPVAARPVPGLVAERAPGFASLVQQFRNDLTLLLFYRATTAYVPPLLLLACVIIFSRQEGVSDVVLRSDPATATGMPFYLGFLSNAGLLLWSAGAVTCLYSSWLLADGQKDMRRLLLGGGVVTAWLLLDDMFMLHEAVLPRLGIREIVVMAVYAVVVPCFLLMNMRRVLQTDPLFLGSALFFLGLSVIVDEVSLFSTRFSTSAQGWLEDGLKLLGISGWTMYWVRTAAQFVTFHGIGPKRNHADG
jgi:hypothetical protein